MVSHGLVTSQWILQRTEYESTLENHSEITVGTKYISTSGGKSAMT